MHKGSIARGLVVALVCIQTIVQAAPATKEFFFEEQADTRQRQLTKSAPEQEIAKLIQDQAHYSDEQRDNIITELTGVGQSNDPVMNALGQLPYGDQLQEAYRLYRILQAVGITPTSISQLIIRNLMNQLGR